MGIIYLFFHSCLLSLLFNIYLYVMTGSCAKQTDFRGKPDSCMCVVGVCGGKRGGESDSQVPVIDNVDTFQCVRSTQGEKGDRCS